MTSQLCTNNDNTVLSDAISSDNNDSSCNSNSSCNSKEYGKDYHNSSISNSGSLQKDGTGDTRLDQGSNLSFEVKLDYLRVAGSFAQWEDLIRAVGFCLGDNEYLIRPEIPFSLGKGVPTYPSSIHTACNAKGGYRLVTGKDGEQYYELILSFSGQYLEKMKLNDHRRLCSGMKHGYGMRATRIDVAIDDFSHQVIPLNEMIAAAESGDCALFQKWGEFSSGEVGKPESKRKTYYFGSRNSRKMVRCYVHDHGDRGESLRFETEFKRGAAPEVFDHLADYDRGDFHNYEDTESVENTLAMALGSYAVGAIDFVNKSQKQGQRINYQDCRRLQCWQDFIDYVGGHIRVAPEVKEVSLGDRVEWCYRQVAKTIKLFRDGLGFERFNNFLHNLIDSATKRWTTDDDLLLNQLKIEVAKGY